jgi:3,4-dihydroxy 2-butanone 4-phosphate synthase/GTP cyclohydrolase II
MEKSEAKLPTKFGIFIIYTFKTVDNQSHAAIVKGNVSGKKDVLVRIHSECLTGDVFHSLKCDCREQLERSIKIIGKEGCGVIVYLRQEGRGIGLFNKIRAYQLQEQGIDTVEANKILGFKADPRDYSIGASILKELGLTTIRLITNNPVKIKGLEMLGIRVTGRVPIIVRCNKYNKKYLLTKREKLGHIFEDEGFIR